MTKAELIEEIVSYVYTNGRGEITGANLQDVLVDMVNILGAAAFLGVGSVQDGDTGVVTGDAVYDALTTALSNYVPTSRKVNNHALTDDITLTLDDIGDGVNRVLNNYFTEADGVVRLKNDYSYFKPRLGLIFDVNSVQNTPAELMKVNVGTDANPVYALKSTLPFFSESWISAGGVSSGGGQAAGNASMQLITGGGRITNGTDTLDVYSMSNTYTKQEVNSLIGSISGFKYEIYASLGDITHPSASVLYLIGPTGSGADKYEEYVYSNSTFVKIGDTSIDLSGYATQSWVGNNYQPLDADLTAIAGLSGTSGLLKKTAANTWTLDTNTYLTGNQTITLSGDVSGSGATSISVSIGAGKVTNTMLAGSIENSKLVNSSITIGSTAVSLGGSITNLAGIGTISMSGALTISTTKKIYFGDTNHYVELDSNGYFHFSHGLYSDSFVSAGGVSSGGGTGGIDLAAMWASLQNNDIVDTYDTYQFAAAHLPTCGSGLSYTISNGIATGINVSFPVTSVAGKTGAVTLAFSDITGTASTSQIPDLSGTYLPLSAGSNYPLTGDLYITGGNGRIVLSGAVQYNVNNTARLLGPQFDGSGYSLQYYNGSAWYIVYHQGNLSLSTLVGGSADIGSATKPVYYKNSTGAITACDYSLSATVNSGTANTIAYYSGTNAVSSYSSTLGASNKPVWLNAGVPTAGDACLPLSAGSSYPLSNDLYITGGSQRVHVSMVEYNPDGGFFLLGPFGGDLNFYNGAWRTVYHSGNLTKSVLTNLLDASGGYYLPLAGGAIDSGSHVTFATTPEYHSGYGAAYTGGIELREYQYQGTSASDSLQYAPGITFHWSGRYAGKLSLYENSLHWGTSVVIDSGNWGNYIGTSTAHVAYADTATNDSAGHQISTYYLPLSGGEMSGKLTMWNRIAMAYSVIEMGGGGLFGAYNPSTPTTLYWYDTNDWRVIYHSGNSNKSDVAWACSNLNASGIIHATTGIYSDGYVTAGSASSREFKDNVQNMSLEYARNIIMSSRPITFQWNALAYSLCDKYEGGGIGFIAQEAEQLMPFAVSPIFEKYKRLDYTAYISPLVRVAQSHETRIQQLENRVKELEDENGKLKARLTN